MIRLVYISRSRLAGEDTHKELADIVQVAQNRNAALQVTGALVHCQGLFAQVLEGSRSHVTAVMNAIRRDPRHGDIKVVEEEPIDGRRFGQWTMASAFVGDASFVQRKIESCLAEPQGGAATGQLVELVATLADRGGVVQ